MTRLNVLLVLVLLFSGIALVRTSYEARRLYAELDRAVRDQQRLDTEYRRLDAERQAAATSQRVERAARERLGMRPAGPAVTAYVQDPGATGTALRAGLPAGASGGRP